MLEADWGSEADEAFFRGAPHYHCIESNDLASVPEVQLAANEGYEALDEAPVWCFLPALWPAHARRWIRDPRVRTAVVSCQGEPTRPVPWSAADYAEIETDANNTLAECGIPPRPPGRIWLLKPPPGHGLLAETLGHLASSAGTAGIPFMSSAALAAHTAGELRRLFNPQG